MILIIHGDDTTSSRNYYFEQKEKLKNPILLNGDGLTYDQIFQNLENRTFFDDKPILLVENFFTKTKSNSIEAKKIIEYINQTKEFEIIFWENSELSKTALAQLKNSKAMLFSFPKVLFTFLDSIKPQNGQRLVELFHELQKTMATELILFMLIRQFRLLISQAGTGSKQIDETKRMAPWQLSKLKGQFKSFNKDNLISLYRKLFDIDLGHKSGKFANSLDKSIDFFLMGL